jgi:uncharacterized cupredoxin-like copper-binding protein
MRTVRRLRSLAIPLAAVALVAAGCGGGKATVKATEKDFSITLDQTSIDAGDVSFSVTNDGPSTHEFVVFRTDLAPDALPVTGATVDESGGGLEVVDEIEDIEPDSTRTLDVNLDAGTYVIICNIEGHYQSGMHAGLTVG